MRFVDDPLPVIDLLLRGAVIGCLALTTALLLRGRARSATARVGAWFALGLAAYVLRSVPGLVPSPPPAWQAPLLALSAGNAVVFWLFCRSLFDDDARLRGIHVGAWAAVVALALLHCYAVAPVPPGQADARGQLLRWLPLAFAALALGEAGSSWRSDLVEPRRRLRAFILIGGAAYTLSTLLTDIAFGEARGAGAAAALADLLALALLVALAAWGLLAAPADEVLSAPAPDGAASRLAPSPAAAADAAPVPDPADAALAARLQQAMAADHAYREEGLTIGGLADRLGVAEHRLRRLINRQLGHRNFNAYVNRWRLDEARRALADPARAAQPVLTIALEAGFQSIGPFNRAFKADSGCTPTEFRRQALGESGRRLADSGIGASTA